MGACSALDGRVLIHSQSLSRWGAVKTIEFRYESASAKLCDMGDGFFELKNVWSDIRGQGHASVMLKEIAHFADVNEFVILLIAAPYGRIRDKPYLDERDLEAFYTKFGFFVQTRKPTRMRRNPEKTTCVCSKL